MYEAVIVMFCHEIESYQVIIPAHEFTKILLNSCFYIVYTV